MEHLLNRQVKRKYKERSWTPKYVHMTVDESKDTAIRERLMRQNGMDPSKKVLLRSGRKTVTLGQWIETTYADGNGGLVGIPH